MAASVPVQRLRILTVGNREGMQRKDLFRYKWVFEEISRAKGPVYTGPLFLYEMSRTDREAMSGIYCGQSIPGCLVRGIGSRGNGGLCG